MSYCARLTALTRKSVAASASIMAYKLKKDQVFDETNLSDLRGLLDAFDDEIHSSDSDLGKLKNSLYNGIANMFPQGMPSLATVDIATVDEGEDQGLFTTQIIRLGHSPIPGQGRLHTHSLTDIRPESRTCREEILLRISHPSLNDFIGAARDCAAIAATASVITAAAGGAIPAAFALFYPSWKLCMFTKVAAAIVQECSLDMFTEGKCGCWDYHYSPSCRLG